MILGNHLPLFIVQPLISFQMKTWGHACSQPSVSNTMGLHIVFIAIFSILNCTLAQDDFEGPGCFEVGECTRYDFYIDALLNPQKNPLLFFIDNWDAAKVVCILKRRMQRKTEKRSLWIGTGISFSRFRSLYIDETLTPDAQGCLERCQMTLGCNFFTHFGNDKNCVMFDNCVEFETDTCEDCLSGNFTCPDLTCGSRGNWVIAAWAIKFVISISLDFQTVPLSF